MEYLNIPGWDLLVDMLPNSRCPGGTHVGKHKLVILLDLMQREDNVTVKRSLLAKPICGSYSYE